MISIFTPSHNTKWLQRTYNSILSQTYDNWEWVIYLNGAAQHEKLPFLDKRVKIFRGEATKSIGELKAKAVSHCSGDYVVELDHDDELVPVCLSQIHQANADVFYSNCAICKDEKSTDPRFGKHWGWEHRQFNQNGINLYSAISPPIHPAHLSLIYYAPDHVRAFRKSFYDTIGGHDSSLEVGDDHDLLIRAYLAGGKFHHCDECLYVYHIHGENSWLKENQKIQDAQWNNHWKYLESISKKWAEDKNLLRVDLGGAVSCPEGYLTYDRRNADIVGDLNIRWKLDDNSVGVLRAHDIIEHLVDPVHTMNEAYRVLAPGGILLISVPDARGQGGFCDPTHKSFWVPRSFRYYTEQFFRDNYLPESTSKFQKISLRELNKWDDVLYVEANLVALKDNIKIHGECLWDGQREK